MLIITKSSHYNCRASFYCTVIHKLCLHTFHISKYFIFNFGNFFSFSVLYISTFLKFTVRESCSVEGDGAPPSLCLIKMINLLSSSCFYSEIVKLYKGSIKSVPVKVVKKTLHDSSSRIITQPGAVLSKM